jgi:hypothetical protein
VSSPSVPAWWRLYCEHREEWEDGDLEEVIADLERRPPNRQLLSPIVASFLAGLVQGGGEVGYLVMRAGAGEVVHVPYVLFRCYRETAVFVLRQVGDAFTEEGRGFYQLYVTGLRAVILLRIVEPYLRGVKRWVGALAARYGYKLSGGRLGILLGEKGLAFRRCYRVVGGRRIATIVPRDLADRVDPQP